MLLWSFNLCNEEHTSTQMTIAQNVNLTLFTSVVMSLIFMTSLKKCNNNFIHEVFVILLGHNHELAMTVQNILEHSFYSMQFLILLCS